VLERYSVLTGVLKSGGRDGSGGQRRLQIGEARGWELVQLAAFPTSLTELERVVRPLLGTDLPARVGKASTVGHRVLLKIGPEQFWIITRNDNDVAPALRSAVDPVLGSITVLSHSRTCIWLDGPAARDVLAMGLAVDLSPDVFELNSFALTGLHHTPIMIHRSSATRYDLYALRTFALWTWEWLVDAALPFGYQISEARKPSTLPRSSANRPVHSS
jgi:methylglutamate dehydrogenase subunit D